MIPGSNVAFNQYQVEQQLSAEEEKALLQSVVIYPITPQLIDTLYAQHADTMRAKNQHKKSFSTNAKGYRYLVAPGDILQVSIWNQPELQNSGDSDQAGIRVDANGNIYFPFVGNLHVAGKTIAQIRQALTRRLATYIKDPQVDVAIASFQGQKAYITGEVRKPGIQPISNLPLTVLDAINQAGGVTERAVWNEVTLNRSGVDVHIPLQKLLQDGDLSYNYLLKNGDVLHIPRNDKYQVILMGEVGKQQNIPLGRYGMTLMEALGQVGGLDAYRADATGIFVIRNHQSATPTDNQIADVYQLDMRDALALALGNKFELKAGDIVYVTTVPIARWNRVISNLMPSVTGLNNLDKLVR